MIRPDTAVVRQEYRASLTGEVSTCRIAGLPATIDLASVYLDGSRAGVRLLELREAIVPFKQNAVITPGGRGLRIELNTPLASAQVRDRAVSGTGTEAVLAATGPGEVSFDLLYAVTGITWEVLYDVVVRGNLFDMTNNIAVDVEGQIKILNNTDCYFSNAVIHLSAHDSGGREAPRKEPGFLYLDEDSPLSDLWRFTPADPSIPHLYSISGHHNLPAGRLSSISHVSVQRKPVVREILVDGQTIPTDSRGLSATPQLVIRLKNENDYGRGLPVPPGAVSIYLGSQQSTIHQKAWFNHTPADGDIEIAMGPADGISIRRMTRDRVERIGGGYEQSYELRLENRLDQTISLKIIEQPPLDMIWAFLRSSLPAEKSGNRLIFGPDIPANSQLIIQYAVRVDPQI